MKLELAQPAEARLKLLDLQAARFENGFVLKRGLTRVFLEAPQIETLIDRLVALTRRDQGATRGELIEAAEPADREMMQSLVEALETRRLLLPAEDAAQTRADDIHEGVFYWTFGTTAHSVRGALETRRLAVIGVNHIGTALAAALERSGFGEVRLVDHPLFRNVALGDAARDAAPFDEWADADDLPDCLVVTTDFGGPALMDDWNAFCVDQGIYFYPVLLHDHVGQLGPLVIPGESACHACVRSRERAGATDFDLRHATDGEAYFAQHSFGFLRPMADAIAGLAATELIKFFSQALPGGNIGKLVEFDLLEPALTTRRVLKAPRCPVCSTVRREPTAAAEPTVFVPGND